MPPYYDKAGKVPFMSPPPFVGIALLVSRAVMPA